MNRDEQLSLNADELELALDRTRRGLRQVEDDDHRVRRAEAIDGLSRYVALLREAPGGGRGARRWAFSFKLEFPDGRWDVEEKELPAPPRLGDVISFEGRGSWRVRNSALVRPRPARKPAREFFVCAPAA